MLIEELNKVYSNEDNTNSNDEYIEKVFNIDEIPFL